MIDPKNYPDLNALLTAAVSEGEKIFVVLNNGDSYQGKAAKLTPEFLVLEAIAGKEFYDASIVLGSISAVEVRAREKL